MDLQWFIAPLHQQWAKQVKICLKHQITYYHPLTDWLLGSTIGNYGHSVMDHQWWLVPLSVISSPPQEGIKQVKIWLKLNFPIVTTIWLVTRPLVGNHVHSLVDLQWLQAPLCKQWVKHLRICLKHQIPYYYLLIDWLLVATIGNHGHLVMDLQ